jgi:hypothetical protein
MRFSFSFEAFGGQIIPGAVTIAMLICFFSGCIRENDAVANTNSRSDGIIIKKEKHRSESVSIFFTERIISPKANMLLFRLNLGDDLKLLKEAPFRLSIESMDTEVLHFEKKHFDRQSESFSLPVLVEKGKTVITVQGVIYYCMTNKSGQCFLEAVDLKIPVNVAENGENLLLIEYEIKQGAE